MAMNPDPTAVMGRRIGAVTIDGAIIYIPLWIWLGSQFTSREMVSADAAEAYCSAFNDRVENGACVNVDDQVYSDARFGDHLSDLSGLGLLAAFVMYVGVQSIAGASVGKLLTGIRVVDEEGTKAASWRVLVRWLMWIVDGLPFLVGPLVGLITGLTSTGHRRVGDMVAKTYVVRKAAVGQPVLLPGDPGTGLTSPPGGLPHNGGMPMPTATTGPQWDEARGTYIQWDPEATAWMQWDDTAKRWDPIPPQPVIPPPPPPPPTPPI
jgi:uncharacterized RDD family membrane protein YckC